MPKKSEKKDDVQENPTEETVEEVQIKICKSVDRHSLGPNGKPDNTKCTLPEGHTGDHKGVHLSRVEKERVYDKVYGKHIDTIYEEIETDVYWSNAAEIPAKDVVEQPLVGRNKKSELLKAVEELVQA